MRKTTSQSECIAAHRPAWQFTGVRTARYVVSRRYSALASELLQFFATHRTATAGQVWRFFCGRFGTQRSVRMHLQTLSAAGDLEVVRTRGMTGPNIYLITGSGLRQVADSCAEPVPSRRRRPSGSHLPHELLITEVAVRLQESERQLIGLRIEWAERFGFQQHACFQGLVPDYAFLTNQAQGQIASLVEVSSGEESITRFRQKLLTYAAWSESEEARRFLTELYTAHGASRPRPQFRLLCVMHDRRGRGDEARVQQLVRAAAEVTPTMRGRIWCITAQALSESSALGAPIWLRVGDLEPVFQQTEPGGARAFYRRLAGAQRAATRHSLFPVEALS